MLLKPEQHLNRFLRELESLVNGYLAVGKRHQSLLAAQGSSSAADTSNNHNGSSGKNQDKKSAQSVHEALQQYQVKCRLMRQQLDELLQTYQRIVPRAQLAERFLEVCVCAYAYMNCDISRSLSVYRSWSIWSS